MYTILMLRIHLNFFNELYNYRLNRTFKIANVPELCHRIQAANQLQPSSPRETSFEGPEVDHPESIGETIKQLAAQTASLHIRLRRQLFKTKVKKCPLGTLRRFRQDQTAKIKALGLS